MAKKGFRDKSGDSELDYAFDMGADVGMTLKHGYTTMTSEKNFAPPGKAKPKDKSTVTYGDAKAKAPKRKKKAGK